MMEHTEGFEEDGNSSLNESEKNINGKRNGGKEASKAKSSRKKDEDIDALSRKRRTAIKLETLTEFAIHHLGEEDGLEKSYLAADACLSLPHSKCIYLL
jgi:hypothetical protein